MTVPSDLGKSLQVYGFFLLVFYTASARDLVRSPYLLAAGVPFLLAGYSAAPIAVVPLVSFASRRVRRAEDLLAVFGLLIVIFCEVFYLREIYTDQFFRMNTVYKFSYVAWILFGIAATTIISRFLIARLSVRRPTPGDPCARGLILALMGMAMLSAPLYLPLDIGGGVLGIQFPGGYQTLDGLTYQETVHPGDAGAVRYMADAPTERGSWRYSAVIMPIRLRYPCSPGS